jgi:methylated-DNA-protein-cysteine methyltransferase-like protein
VFFAWIQLPPDLHVPGAKPETQLKSRSRSATFERIYAAVRRIPRGRVATYGQIASLSGVAGDARLVGYALSALPEHHDVPWHRVINARGEISRHSSLEYVKIQRAMLEAEDIEFDEKDKISLERFQWRPRMR